MLFRSRYRAFCCLLPKMRRALEPFHVFDFICIFVNAHILCTKHSYNVEKEYCIDCHCIRRDSRHFYGSVAERKEWETMLRLRAHSIEMNFTYFIIILIISLFSVSLSLCSVLLGDGCSIPLGLLFKPSKHHPMHSFFSRSWRQKLYGLFFLHVHLSLSKACESKAENTTIFNFVFINMFTFFKAKKKQNKSKENTRKKRFRFICLYAPWKFYYISQFYQFSKSNHLVIILIVSASIARVLHTG